MVGVGSKHLSNIFTVVCDAFIPSDTFLSRLSRCRKPLSSLAMVFSQTSFSNQELQMFITQHTAMLPCLRRGVRCMQQISIQLQMLFWNLKPQPLFLCTSCPSAVPHRRCRKSSDPRNQARPPHPPATHGEGAHVSDGQAHMEC